MRLHTLVVSPSASGKGYGKKLVKFYEDYVLSHGCPELRMDTNARNVAARGLYKKLGIRYVSITSGKNKDSSKFTDEQIAIYQDQINEAYEKFVNIVADGRDMSVEDVKKLADGRTYTAKQAKNNGLIDEISLYPDMKDAMSKKLGTSTFYEMESDEGLLQSLFSKAESLVPKSEAQVLTETAKSVESGVPMYYAEQLR